jgi:FAD/FMN-containing dehydrogenase
MADALLLADLRSAVGEQNLLTGDRIREIAIDALGHVPRASTLVRPRNTAEVSAVLRLCHARGQPVVPQGGLTGLVEGTVTSEHDVILSIERLNQIEAVDAAGRTMRVGAGVKLQQAQEEADRHGLLFPLDLGARGSCTIGGNVATNAGGVRVLRYGMMRSLVLGLEAVLADGTVLCSLNRMIKNNAGYDLKQLFIGSEGTLGVVTRVDLRLFARPSSAGTAIVACQDFSHLVKLLSLADAQLAGQLSAFEALWPEFYEATTTPPSPRGPVLPHGYGIYGLLETLGTDAAQDQERLERVLSMAFEQGLIIDAAIAKSESERRAMWEVREDVFQTRRHGPNYNYDVSLAIGQMPAYLEQVRANVAREFPDARVFAFGHIADGNVHVVVAPGLTGSGIHTRVDLAVYEPLRPIGGSIAAEHGIGLERRMYLNISRTAEEIATMRLLKHALDPKGILNPGKIFN